MSRAIGRLCVCRTITFERNDLWPTHVARCFILKLSRSSLQVKATGYRRCQTSVMSCNHFLLADWRQNDWTSTVYAGVLSRRLSWLTNVHTKGHSALLRVCWRGHCKYLSVSEQNDTNIIAWIFLSIFFEWLNLASCMGVRVTQLWVIANFEHKHFTR